MIGRGWADEPEKANPNDERDGHAERRARSARDEEPARVWTNEDFSVDNDLADDEVTVDDLVVGLPTRPVVGPAIRRTARWWCAAGLVGLVIGAALFTKVLPPPYKATSSVLIDQPAPGDASDAMLTDVQIAGSNTVAEAAMRKLGLPVNAKSVQTFVGDYTAASQSVGPNGVLDFTTKATSSSAAVSRAQALAEAFLQVRNAELKSELAATIASINQQISLDTQHVSLLTKKIHYLSGQPPTTARQAQIASLQTQRTQASGILAGVTTSARLYEATTNAATQSAVKGSQVLDRALAVPRSRLKYPLYYFGGGLAGGLAVGLGLVIVIALVSTRLRRRDDIARALGAPVGLSLGRVRLTGRGMAAARKPEIRQIVGHLRRLLPAGNSAPATLALVAVDAPDVAAVTLASLALSYAREGKRVLVADLSPDAAVGRLLGRTDPGVHNVTVDGQQLVIARPDADDLAPLGPRPGPGSAPNDATRPSRPLDRVYAAAEVMLTLTILDPALGADHLATWAADSAVILTAGESKGTKIHTIGQMIRLAGVSLVSAILLGADKDDVSFGAADLRVTSWAAGEVADQAAPAVQAAPDGQAAPGVPDGLADGRDGTRGEVASTTISN
jgi:capsular polysaccharide biosynthesis protein